MLDNHFSCYNALRHFSTYHPQQFGPGNDISRPLPLYQLVMLKTSLYPVNLENPFNKRHFSAIAHSATPCRSSQYISAHLYTTSMCACAAGCASLCVQAHCFSIFFIFSATVVASSATVVAASFLRFTSFPQRRNCQCSCHKLLSHFIADSRVLDSTPKRLNNRATLCKILGSNSSFYISYLLYFHLSYFNSFHLTYFCLPHILLLHFFTDFNLA